MSSDAVGAAYDVLEAARDRLRTLLVVFLLGLVSTILFLRRYAFDAIQTQTLENARAAAEGTGFSVEVGFINPFEVILLQAKIGIIVGVLVTVPYVVYGARDSLRRRGLWFPERVPRSRLALFVVGVLYAYLVMIPLMLEFVVRIAVEADVKPLFRISSFVDFVLVYSVIFGVAAQLPLIMSFTVRAGLVSYRFYRSKWRHFIVIAAVVSALITSPDPLTQLVVLGPVVGVYFLGLGVTRVTAREVIREREERRSSMATAPSDPKGGEDPGGPEPAPNGGAEADTAPSPTREAVSSATDGLTGGLMERGLVEIIPAVVDDMRDHSKRLGLLFLVVSSAAFYWLIYYGIETIRDDTLSYMDPGLAEQVQTVQLEIFEFVFLVVKYSALLGAAVVLPVALYYSRESLADEGVIQGDASPVYYLTRIGAVVALFVAGSLYAYYGMIPVLISILSNSIVESGMDATFTVGKFIDFVVLITVLVGIIAELPATMYFLVSSRIVRYETLKDKWRHFTILVLIIGALVTSPDPFTMMVVAVPLSGFYLVSLATTRVLCHRTIKRVRTERKEIGLEA